jgi:hypothetical protein
MDMPSVFMVSYKDAYGALHNQEILARDIDSAWKLAMDLVSYECRIQQIWCVK